MDVGRSAGLECNGTVFHPAYFLRPETSVAQGVRDWPHLLVPVIETVCLDTREAVGHTDCIGIVLSTSPGVPLPHGPGDGAHRYGVLMPSLVSLPGADSPGRHQFASPFLSDPGKLGEIMVEHSPFGFVRCGRLACRIPGFYIAP